MDDKPSRCPRCEGSGRYTRLGFPEKFCALCDGTGEILAEPMEEMECPFCDGTGIARDVAPGGWDIRSRCPECKGTGKL